MYKRKKGKLNMENIKERLAAGESVEDLMKEMQSQVIAAARELENEKKVNDALDDARVEFAQAIIKYVDAMGLISTTKISNKDIEVLEEVLKEYEEEFKVYAPVIKAMMDAEKAKENRGKRSIVVGGKPSEDYDDILKDFLRSL